MSIIGSGWRGSEAQQLASFGHRETWPPASLQRIEAGRPLSAASLPYPWNASLGNLEELVVLADALRAMQRADGSFVSSESSLPLKLRGSEILARMADKPEVAATGLISANQEGIWTNLRTAHRVGARPNVYLHWGPLATWRGKSLALLHSFVFAIADEEMDVVVAEFDSWAVPEGGRYLSDLFGSIDIRIGSPPQFFCSRAVFRGGEAAIPPYHFAYFLPEDEGIQGPSDAALVFINGYRARFEKISLPLAHRLLGASRAEGKSSLFVGQLLWLRSHDICHNVQLLGTDWGSISSTLGPVAVAVLGEVAADVFGYLLLTAAPILPASLPNEAEIALAFMAEMLHYLRREPNLFPDSAAACLELNYLVQHEWLHINEDLSLDWSPKRLRAGFEALGRELLGKVLGGDPTTAQQFLRQYGAGSAPPRTAAAVSPLLHLLGYQLPHIPTIATA